MGPNFNDVKVNKIIIVILISSIHTTIMIIVKSNFTINCLSLSLPPVLKRNCSRFFKVCVGLCNNAVFAKEIWMRKFKRILIYHIRKLGGSHLNGLDCLNRKLKSKWNVWESVGCCVFPEDMCVNTESMRVQFKQRSAQVCNNLFSPLYVVKWI